MARALRMAKKDSDGACVGTSGKNYEVGLGDSIKFLKFDYTINSDVCYYFSLNSGRIYESKDGAVGVPLTSDKLSVNSLKFNLSGDVVGESPNLQPRVTIFLEIESKRLVPGSPPKIQIQTSVSQRALDTGT